MTQSAEEIASTWAREQRRRNGLPPASKGEIRRAQREIDAHLDRMAAKRAEEERDASRAFRDNLHENIERHLRQRT